MLQVLVLALQGLYLLIRVFFSTLFTRFWAFILFALPAVLKKILGYLGLGFVSFTGFQFIINQLKTFVMSRFDSFPADVLNIILLAKVDVGISVIFAGMTISITIKLIAKSASLGKTQGSIAA